MDKPTVQKLYIAYTSGYVLQYIISGGLDLLVLFAYYRLGKRLNSRAAALVTSSLRAASIRQAGSSSDFEVGEMKHTLESAGSITYRTSRKMDN